MATHSKVTDIAGQAQVRFWLGASAGFLFLLWLLSPILLPFVAGLAIAYFLNPAVAALRRRTGIPRGFGAVIVLLGFLAVVVAILLILVPLVQSQVSALIDAVPGYAEQVRKDFMPWLKQVLKLSSADLDRLRGAAGEHAGEAVNWGAKVLQKILTGSFAIFDILTLVLITPLIAFYVLHDWDRLTGIIDQSLPRRQYGMIKEQLDAIDRTLAGFMRGQALVCIALGAYYALALSVIGLNFGASVGITAGLLSFIPYVGTTFGWLTSLLLGAAQYDDPSMLGVIIGIFIVGQIMEGYFLTPKLVGNRVGLHPVWILFGLFAGGYLLGFVGVLVAVPVTAVIGVLVRFLMQHYRASRYYDDASTE